MIERIKHHVGQQHLFSPRIRVYQDEEGACPIDPNYLQTHNRKGESVTSYLNKRQQVMKKRINMNSDCWMMYSFCVFNFFYHLG